MTDDGGAAGTLWDDVCRTVEQARYEAYDEEMLLLARRPTPRSEAA